MKALLCGVAFLAAVAPVKAEARYDRNLEKAAMEIVASRMGDIRGGFSFGQVPQLVLLPNARQNVSISIPRQPAGTAADVVGLKPVVERQASRPGL
ncbi:hypothetical protein [Mesorhizobium sp. ES1-1]|uniref:hypothetical protein n=1 Tax=Mesorhizobium sp. ES1-1 TaxID=2876629 RepID=UPI001CCF9C42|nr:hypothetical protein [Mesorhizobium sp. ES1-1]MBZ9674167.1 hypothetical protein [Mesorhizobium sp. ES1-1]